MPCLMPHYILTGCNPSHLTDYGESGSMIKKELLTNVATNGNFKVNNTQDHIMTPLEGKTIVSRAEKRLGQKFRYNPETNNCETFASEMRYGDGKGFSEQVLLAVFFKPVKILMRKTSVI